MSFCLYPLIADVCLLGFFFGQIFGQDNGGQVYFVLSVRRPGLILPYPDSKLSPGRAKIVSREECVAVPRLSSLRSRPAGSRTSGRNPGKHEGRLGLPRWAPTGGGKHETDICLVWGRVKGCNDKFSPQKTIVCKAGDGGASATTKTRRGSGEMRTATYTKTSQLFAGV